MFPNLFNKAIFKLNKILLVFYSKDLYKMDERTQQSIL